MKRRSLVTALLTLPAAGLIIRSMPGADSSTMTNADIEAMQADWEQLMPQGFQPPSVSDQLKLSAAEWRERLTPAQFDVLREDGTERPFTSPLNNEKQAGLYVCAGCELPLFTSQMKYDSGTGWPSFFTTIPDAMGTKRDYRFGWTRTEYHCARCKGHQGHVFNDGPKPTGQRWCNNGVALKFLAAS